MFDFEKSDYTAKIFFHKIETLLTSANYLILFTSLSFYPVSIIEADRKNSF